jgi:hypothetical protein
LPDEFIDNEIAGMNATRDLKAKPDLKKQVDFGLHPKETFQLQSKSLNEIIG